MRALRELMTDTIQVEPWTGQDRYGAATYGTAVSYPARIVGKVRLVRDAQGQEVVSRHTIYVGANPNMSPKDRVTLSTAYAGSTEEALRRPPLVHVGRFPDGRAGDLGHTALFLA